jgi:hypothetical protein
VRFGINPRSRSSMAGGGGMYPSGSLPETITATGERHAAGLLALLHQDAIAFLPAPVVVGVVAIRIGNVGDEVMGARVIRRPAFRP